MITAWNGVLFFYLFKLWDDLEESTREVQATVGWLTAVSVRGQNWLFCSQVFAPSLSLMLSAPWQGMQVMQCLLSF